jgi:epoxide hydrolase 4
VPNVRVERLLDASHWVQLDQSERVNALLLDFLRKQNRVDHLFDADDHND